MEAKGLAQQNALVKALCRRCIKLWTVTTWDTTSNDASKLPSNYFFVMLGVREGMSPIAKFGRAACTR
jgi:hypothetical protein